MKHKILGATVWTGVDGFGKRRRSTVTIEGITINRPLVIEVIDEKSKLEPLLPELKIMVDDNGLVTILNALERWLATPDELSKDVNEPEFKTMNSTNRFCIQFIDSKKCK